MQSSARTVEDYLSTLPVERQKLISRVRDVVNDNLPDGYQESMSFGMISWHIPLARYGNTYNKQPLQYVALASQKNYCSLYLMGVYADREENFRARWHPPSGKKLNMGKSCVRFSRLEDLDLDLIADTIAATSVDDYIANYEAIRAAR
jgi:Domain of unknown function (DU1801)